jgi:hypothetical protein
VNAYKVTNFPYEYHSKVGNVVQGNGTLVIPFECEEVPEGAKFMYAGASPIISIASETIIIREIVGGNVLSKYAYFKINK